MTTIILAGTTVLQACDSAQTNGRGDVEAMSGEVVSAVYPAQMGVTVVDNVTLPSPWPGYGYTYANGVFTALPAPPAPVPESVSPRQARLALAQDGLLTTVNNAVAAADQATQIAWDYATEIRRDNPLIAAVAAGLSPPLTSSQVDDLFRLAATL